MTIPKVPKVKMPGQVKMSIPKVAKTAPVIRSGGLGAMIKAKNIV